MKYSLNVLLLFFVISLMSSCDNNKVNSNNNKKGFTIVTTTGMVGDLVKNVVKDKGEVITLMGPGVDPHLYKATPGDVEKLQKADIIFYNGLYLEAKLEEVLEKLARQKSVFPVAGGIDKSKLLKISEGKGKDHYDPHIWFDVSLWIEALEEVNKKMQEKDAANASFYQQNTLQYKKLLSQKHKTVKAAIQDIPQAQRVLITSHDAFGYFGKAYDIEVDGLQGISTVTEPGLKDITDMVDKLTKRKIKAVFVESSVPKKSIEAVVEGCKKRGHNIVIGGELFTDAMGAKGTPEGAYLGMVQHNVDKITGALK